MSAMRKAAQYLGFDVNPNTDEDYSEEELAPVTHLHEGSASRPEGVSVAPNRSHAVRTEAPDLRRIQTVKPRTYQDARLIGEAFREGVPVIMNLTEMTDADAKRMVDFSAGLSFGLHGSLERVTTAVFLLSPAHVEIGLDEQPVRTESEFFNDR